ncbi:MAG: hypothetical protein Q9180_003855 [Flavoplaca navasiana]
MYLRSVLFNVSVLIPTVYSAILGDLRPAFINPLPPARGSCSVDQLQELTIGFREAIDATKKAAQAIDNLKNSAPNSLIHKDKNRTWKRQAQLLKALFNIDVDKKLGDGNNDANLLQNEPAVDGSGRPIPGDANGWQRGAALARHDPARARQAPDLYALFATAVYLDNFGWGTGVAEK